jgi:LCP family protein required for cell wall assembly
MIDGMKPKSMDGVMRPNAKRENRQIGMDGQLQSQIVAQSVLPEMMRPITKKKNDLFVEKKNTTGSLVEPEELARVGEAKKEKVIKLSKKGRKKLFKSIQKGKVDANNPAEIRAWAVKFRRKTRARRIAAWLVVCAVGVAGYFGWQVYQKIDGSLDGIFAGGNIFDVVKKDPLKKDINGRTNVLIFGTEGYDPSGSDHPGANLTDSIMVASFGEEKGDVFTVSLPRDLEVKHSCANYLGTWYGKLNETYTCIYDGDANRDGVPDHDEELAANELRGTVSEILGLDVQYSVHVNFAVLIDAVDAVGGVDVLIESDDPRGILDRNFDWECNYRCHYVNYENGEVAHLDGVHALALARARNAAGGYGLPRSNFDREINQQKILAALALKAKETNFVADPGKTLDLISSMGENIHTTFKVSEINTLIGLAQGLSLDGGKLPFKRIELLNEEYPQYSVIDGAGQPLAGQFQYRGIQKLINRVMTGELDLWTPEAEDDAQNDYEEEEY